MGENKLGARKAEAGELFPELTTWLHEQDRVMAEASKDWNTALSSIGLSADKKEKEHGRSESRAV
jgi:hypothetical protein